MTFQPMTMQQDQRMMSGIFFLRDELPAHDDTIGSKDGVSNIFSQG